MNPEYRLRKAVPEDIPAIQALYIQEEEAHRSLYPDYFHPTHTLLPAEILQKELQDPDSVYLVAAADEQVVGFLYAKRDVFSREPHFRKVEFALVEDCVVGERHRRKGIATALMQEVRNWARQQGLQRVQLQVWADNRAAKSLYDALGYRDLIVRMELKEPRPRGR